jgi:hypothetical protein
MILTKSQRQDKCVASDTNCVSADWSGLRRRLLDLSVMRVDEGWSRLMMREVRVVLVQWVLSLVLLEVGGRCIPSSRIWCSMALIPSFFWLIVLTGSHPSWVSL